MAYNGKHNTTPIFKQKEGHYTILKEEKAIK